MRYTIGISITDKKTKEIKEGYYGLGSYGLGYVLTDECLKELKTKKKLNDYWIYVFDNCEEVEYYCRYLAVNYRRDDVWTNKTLKSKKIRRFYPLKIDSSKFKLVLDEGYLYGELKKDLYRRDLVETKKLPKKRILDLK